MLSTLEKERYIRHLIIPDFGEEGQLQLKQAKVLVIGAGGLGGSLLYYLTASGIGKIGIADYDNVVLSNLQRQILFTETDIGKNKAESAVQRLKQLNSLVNFEIFPQKLDDNFAIDTFPEYDIIAGATDNFNSRVIIDRYCEICNKPFVHASIYEFECQVAVFHYQSKVSYRELFGDLPADNQKPIGVFAPLVGLTGCLMAGEIIKIILNKGQVLNSKMLIYNMITHEWKIIKIE